MQPLSARCMRILLRFRLGAHSLLVVVSCRTGTPRAQRLSQHCDQHAVGDERHMMFECPALQAVRDTMLHCLPVVQALQQELCGGTTGVAQFVVDLPCLLDPPGVDDVPSHQP